MTIPALVGVTIAGAMAHGAFHRNSVVFGRALGRLPTRERRIALTFDDGPNPEATPRVLDALAQYGVRATFFILGAHAERWPDLVERMAKEGHQLGNHGYYHRRLTFRSPAYVHEDILRGTTAIEAAAGQTPLYFRAPHGFRSPWVSAIAASVGQRTIGWSLGVWDSDKPGVKEIVKRTVDGAKPGSIVLLHDGDGRDPDGDRRQTAKAVPRIISGLRERGYTFVTLPA